MKTCISTGKMSMLTADSLDFTSPLKEYEGVTGQCQNCTSLLYLSYLVPNTASDTKRKAGGADNNIVDRRELVGALCI